MEKEISAICIFTNSGNLVYEVGGILPSKTNYNLNNIQEYPKITKIHQDMQVFEIFSGEKEIARIVRPDSYVVEYFNQ